jgi:hypothetical protein
MQKMDRKALIDFLKGNIEPIKDNFRGNGYRASAYLKDGTFLPCVIFYNSNIILDKLKKTRFFSKGSVILNRWQAWSLITHGNRVEYYDIKSLGNSKYAIPVAILNKIESETSMGWTNFIVKMRDGKYFSFGTTFTTEFFDMPEGYMPDDIVDIINHSYFSEKMEICNRHSNEKLNEKVLYRERLFFRCYMDDL